MGFINDIVKTVIDTGKKAIQSEVKEQTENTIESVSKKVSDTISSAGDKFENTVKTSIDGIGKNDATATNVNGQGNIGVSGAYNGASLESVIQMSNQPTSNGQGSLPNMSVNTYNPNMTGNMVNFQAQQQANNPNLQTNMVSQGIQPVSNQGGNINSNVASKSIASDVANILEKKNLGDRNDLVKSANALETEITSKLNEVTDALNSIYGKDTTQNDRVDTVAGAFDHLLDATSNIGGSTDNELGKIINQAVQDNPGFQEGLAEMNKESEKIVDKLQEGINNYKDLK